MLVNYIVKAQAYNTSNIIYGGRYFKSLVLQIEDILVGDKQLAKEILYDMKQAELAKERDPAAALPAPAQPAPAQPSARQGPAAPGQPHGETSAAPPSPMPGLSSRRAKSHKHSQSRVRHSAGAYSLVLACFFYFSGYECLNAARITVHPVNVCNMGTDSAVNNAGAATFA